MTKRNFPLVGKVITSHNYLSVHHREMGKVPQIMSQIQISRPNEACTDPGEVPHRSAGSREPNKIYTLRNLLR